MGNSCKKPPSVSNRGEYNVDGYLKVIERDRQVITVLEIGHYRDTFESSGMELMHAFIGLRVRVEGRVRLIKAEKSPGEIKISIEESLQTNGTEIKHGPVGVEYCGEIEMGHLLAILKEHSPDYFVLSDNCWLYADSTFRRLIRNFLARPNISPERRSELEGFLNHPAPTMPDNVIASSVAAVLGGAGLDRVASTAAGASFLDDCASAVTANLFLPQQLAQVAVILKSATVQNSLHHACATLAKGGMRTIATVRAPAPALLQILSAPQTMQAIAAAQSQAQTMLLALSPAVAIGVSVAIGVCVALFILYKLRQLALEARPRGQQRLSRRRTGPSMPLP